VPARWYLARVIGTGIEDDPFRAAVADHAITGHSAVIPTDSDGNPIRQWALVRVNADDYTDIDASADTELVCDDTRDALVSSIPAARRIRIAAAATRLGLNLTVGEGVLIPTLRLRVLLRALGRALDPAFTEDRLG
jgi:hypothetical protein